MHSTLIVGGSPQQRNEEALKVASKNSSPFDTYVFNAALNSGIDFIRETQNRLSLKPLNSDFTTTIIHNAHELTLSAQNAFLKTLEEPPPQSLIIMTANNSELLLPTILSRCLKIPLPNQLEDKESHYEKTISDIEDLSLSEKMRLSESLELDLWINAARLRLRKVLLSNQPKGDLRKILNVLKPSIKALELSRFNVNKKLLLENLFLD